MLGGVFIAIGWPWLLGPKPGSDPTAKLKYLERGGTLVFSAVFCLVMAAIGAALIVRVAREEYAALKESNMRELITGAQQDVRKKQSDD